MHWIWTAASVATAGLLFTRTRARSGSRIYLTFDDGPHPEHTPQLLDLLREHDAKATFFLLGKQIERNMVIVRRMVAEGHVIANHSYSHRSFDVSPMSVQREEIERTDQLLAGFDGKRRHLVRPPHGKLGMATIILCLLRRQRIALWNRDSLDYRLDGEGVLQRVMELNVGSGDVLLFHDDGGSGIEALRILLPRWREAGFRFDTL